MNTLAELQILRGVNKVVVQWFKLTQVMSYYSKAWYRHPLPVRSSKS